MNSLREISYSEDILSTILTQITHTLIVSEVISLMQPSTLLPKISMALEYLYNEFLP